jgi:phosphoheptose isomerase
MNYDKELNQLCNRYPLLNSVKDSIRKAAQIIIDSYSSGGKLIVCGNGGSCSDSDHFVGELMKCFELKRPVKKDFSDKLADISSERGKYLAQKLECGLPAISLCSHTSLTTAISNDVGPDLIFAQQVLGYGRENDVLLGISTSGNSQNVIDACITARAMNIKVIGLTGSAGGKMKEFCNILLNVPEKQTAPVQELHLPVMHVLCRIIENYFFG